MQASKPEATYITLNGSHSVNRRPELADLHFRISHEAFSAKEASTAVTTTANEIVKSLQELAPPKSNASARDDSVIDGSEWPVPHPEYPITAWVVQRIVTNSWIPNKKTRRYSASTSLVVTFHDFSALETLTTSLSAKDNIKIDTIDWRVSPTTRNKLQTSIRQEALRSAYAAAADYAKVINPQATVRPVEVNDHAGGGYGSSRMAMAKGYTGMSEEDNSRLTFEPEPVEISANVNVKFKLE